MAQSSFNQCTHTHSHFFMYNSIHLPTHNTSNCTLVYIYNLLVARSSRLPLANFIYIFIYLVLIPTCYFRSKNLQFYSCTRSAKTAQYRVQRAKKRETERDKERRREVSLTDFLSNFQFWDNLGDSFFLGGDTFQYRQCALYVNAMNRTKKLYVM